MKMLLGITFLLAGCGLADLDEETLAQGLTEGPPPLSTTSLKAQVDKAVWDNAGDWRKWMVVAAISPAGSGVYYYSSTQALYGGGASMPTANHAFRLGSLSKTFTGTLLALQDGTPGGMSVGRCNMRSDGDTLLATALQEVCPSCGPLPAHRAGIRIEQLATHNAGLSRHVTEPVCDVEELFQSVGRVMLNLSPPPSGIGCVKADDPLDPAEKNKNCADWKYCWDPGTYHYSSWGFDLLGHIMAARAHTTFDELNRDEILDPLGMSHTFGGSETNPAIRTSGWKCDTTACTEVTHEPTENYLSTPQGGMWSTGPDMLKYLRFVMGINVTPSFAEARELIFCDRDDGPANDTVTESFGRAGLGWNLNLLRDELPKSTERDLRYPADHPDDLIWNKAGDVDDFHAYIAFSPARGAGIVVMTNTSIGKGPKAVANTFLGMF